MAALAAAYRTMDCGSLVTTDRSVVPEEESFEFLPHTDPATFVEEFQKSTSADNRWDNSVISQLTN